MNILITGVSRGIGKELVKEFSKEIENVIIGISRNEEALNSLRWELSADSDEVNFHVFPYDMQKILAHPESFIDKISSIYSHVDVMINNAGFLAKDTFESFSFDSAKQIFDVNFFAIAKSIELLITNNLIASGTHVVNIGSMAGFQGSSKFPGLSYYSASKAAISCLTECLAEEYKEKDIKFNCLALGAVQTEMLVEAFPGFNAPVTSNQMAAFIKDFAIRGKHLFNGKVLPVALNNP